MIRTLSWANVAAGPSAEMFPDLVVHRLLPDGRFLTTYPPRTTLYPVASRTAVLQITADRQASVMASLHYSNGQRQPHQWLRTVRGLNSLSYQGRDK